ncbi:DUF262 domain-containing protein [Kitasatospora purpeofusca]|uniref:DUF262 domain-containing protein n=1 Tax=Kitasatospora purpeofusca TaxID=67352 RepID=UPI0036601EF4
MAFGASSVTPRSVAVGTLLEEHHPFFIPRYQRSYAWDTQVAAFTDDVSDLVNADPQEASHFLGGIVCIEETDHSQSRPHKYEIVDGQQRMATVVLALAEIEYAANGIAKSATQEDNITAAASAEILASDTRDRFLFWRNSIVSEGRKETLPRLILSDADNQFFRDLINGSDPKPERESHQLLAAARAQIRAALIKPALEKVSRQEAITHLDRLRTAIVSQCHVIQIVSADRERAYQLFSVLNDRGRSLEDADLLRSYTLEVVQGFPEPQEKIAKLWDEILKVPAKEVSDFFRAYYPSTTGARATLPLFKKLREEYFPLSSATTIEEANTILERVKAFRDEQRIFAQIQEGSWPYPAHFEAGKVPAVTEWQKDRLKRLVISLKHELAMPLLLAAANVADEKKFFSLVQMLEVFAFRYKNVCGGHATAPGNAYYAAAKKIRELSSEGKPTNWDSLRLALRSLIEKVAPDDQFRNSLENRLRYDFGAAQRANICELLTTIEDHAAWLAKGGAGIPKPNMVKVIDLGQVTLEHIYPQNPSPADVNEELSKVRDRIGNLTFFGPGENSKAGNKSFSVKRQGCYSESTVGMTQKLAQLPDWNIAAYNIRRDELLDDACKVFKI